MRKMKENSGENGFDAIFVDVSDCTDELHFVERLYKEILKSNVGNLFWNQVKESWLRKAFEHVKTVSGGGVSLEFRTEVAPWTRMGDELAGALSKLGGRCLIQIDELPLFVLKLLNQEEPEGSARAKKFLYWMRSLRQQYLNVRWMLAGSIGLDTVAVRLNVADAINDLRLEKLGAFDAGTADALLQALSMSYQVTLNARVRAYILTRTGWLAPYYLQLIFCGLRKHTVITESDVDQVIEDLLGPHNRCYFDYSRQRLYQELARVDADYAVMLLNICCRAPEGVARSTLSLILAGSISDPTAYDEKLCFLLGILQNDDYLVEEQKRWRFKSPLLREYWLRRMAPQEKVV
jgi:hypothetical protein